MTEMIPQERSEHRDVGYTNFTQRMERFKRAMELHSDVGYFCILELHGLLQRHRPDLLAYADMRAAGDIARTPVGKHPEGVQLATSFEFRAELAVAGVHKELMRGISVDSQSGVAEAIVFSGYYASNEDTGDSFVYSGEGGLRNGVQMADQQWTQGNLGLRRACELKTPIRVIRCVINKSKEKRYYYDGLYQIRKCWTEKKNDLDVCLFKGQGIEGEYSVSGKVGYNPRAFHRSNSRRKWERRVIHEKRPRKEGRIYGHFRPIHAILEAEKNRVSQLKNRSDVRCLDISHGKERLCVPVINNIDDEDAPTGFRYVTTFGLISDTARSLIESSRAHWCLTGDENQTSNSYYVDGLLRKTVPEGIRECTVSSESSSGNRVVSQGLRYPLEVYKTREKGWGVRSTVDIPIGAFVCEYLGRVISDDEAEDVNDSAYLYSLDHFFLLKEQILTEALPDFDLTNVPPLPLSDEYIVKKEYNGKYLVIDASSEGNVGRFLNHSCLDGANLVAMMVLQEGCNGVFHHIAFFASENIPKMTELCYNYGSTWTTAPQQECRCGTRNCQGFIM